MCLLAGLVTLQLAACESEPAPERQPWGPEVLVASGGVEYLAHEVIVKRPRDVSEEDFLAGIEALRGQFAPDARGSMTKLGYYQVVLPDDVIADEAISHLLSRGLVDDAERNYVVDLEAVPSDSLYGQLWGMRAIEAERAWDMSTGDREVVVAVIDTGIDLEHPDLRDNLWINAGEVAGNGIDDDGNGYVDDVHGYNFLNHQMSPDDDHGHGTQVAGTIGATGNNGVGVVGVNWQVRMQALRFFDAAGRGTTWGAAQAIVYAARNGAHVVNASYGCHGSETSYGRQALEELAEAGGLFVAAAGNYRIDNDVTPFYPASYDMPHVVSVAASAESGQLASFSNYGRTSVDLAAPGEAILSTSLGGTYADRTGTSMATAHVTGAAALYLAHHPDTEATLLANKLRVTVRDEPTLEGVVQAGGVLQVEALLRSHKPPPPAPMDFAAVAGPSGEIELSWTAPDHDGLAQYEILHGPSPGQYVDKQVVEAGTHSLTLEGLPLEVARYFVIVAWDNLGNVSERSPEISATPNDEVPPPPVLDLTVSTDAAGALASGYLLEASGENDWTWFPPYQAVDGSRWTDWATPARSVPQEEFITLALDREHQLGRVELWPSRSYPEFFPRDYELEISDDANWWEVVGGERGVRLGPADVDNPRIITFAATRARYVRLRVITSNEHASGFGYVMLAEMEAYDASSVGDSLLLTFTAPGDNPGRGAAASYDIRVSRMPFDEDDFAAQDQADAPTPSATPLREQVRVDGLLTDTTYYFALTATDAAGNTSGMSNLASATTRARPPAAIVDLSVVGHEHGQITLEWTAPFSEDGTDAPGSGGQAEAYELRYATYPLTVGNFEEGTIVATDSPAMAGSRERQVVDGLSPQAIYYFAIRSYDRAQASALSNVVSEFAQGGPDTTPPATVDNLRALGYLDQYYAELSVVDATEGTLDQAQHLIDDSLHRPYVAPAGDHDEPVFVTFDMGEVSLVTSLRLHPTLSHAEHAYYPQDFVFEGSVDGTVFTPITDIQGIRPKEAVEWNHWVLDPTYARYLRWTVTGRGPGDCNSQPCDGVEVMAAELEVCVGEGIGWIDLHWISAGDDGYLGEAYEYEVRVSRDPVTDDNWDDAELMNWGWAPGGQLVWDWVDGVEEGISYAAVRTWDEVANVSGVSNNAIIDMPLIPPGPVDDLFASAIAPDAVELEWTASGDDGPWGQATGYDLRYDTKPIDAAGWDSARAVLGPPVPGWSGDIEYFQVAGLSDRTTYYFALRSQDDMGQISTISNQAVVTTLDGTPPAAVTDLSAHLVPELVDEVLAMVASSPSHSPQMSAERLLDGDPDTDWLSQAGEEYEPRFVHVALLEPGPISRVSLGASRDYPDLFPAEVTVAIRGTADGPFEVQARTTAGPAGSGALHLTLGSVYAHEVRLEFSRARAWAGAHHVALSGLAVYPDQVRSPVVELAWTAPGNNGDEGQAGGFDVRRADAPIEAADFDRATPLPGAPEPGPAGTWQRMVGRDLTFGEQHCFALKTEDGDHNVSNVSNSACVTTPSAPPGGIGDLTGVLVGPDEVQLSWTAPGAGTQGGSVDHYEVRRHDGPIHPENWDDATAVFADWTPVPPGQIQRFNTSGLSHASVHHFAVVAIDSEGQRSVLSNNAVVRTPDVLPPGAIADLTAHPVDPAAAQLAPLLLADYSGRYSDATTAELAFDGHDDTVWLSNGGAENEQRYLQAELPELTRLSDLALLASATYPDLFPVDLRFEVRASEAEVWRVVARDTDLHVSPGWQRWALGSVEAKQVRLVIERSAAWSGAHYAAIAEMVAFEDNTVRSAVRLRWTATGDDLDVGRAAAYDMRESDRAIDQGTFESANGLDHALVPQPAGSLERMQVDNLVPGSHHCFAVRAQDDEGLVGPASNSPCVDVPSLPPGVITDLRVSEVGATSLTLAWTATGDEGHEGQADHYDFRVASERIHADNWHLAEMLPDAPAPRAAGTGERFTVTGLAGLTSYYFAVRAVDAGGALGGVSNNIRVTTADDIPPAAVTDLVAATDNARWGSVLVAFTAPGDSGVTGQAASYDLRRAPWPIDDSNWDQAAALQELPTQAAGTRVEATVDGLNPESHHYLALRAVDVVGNVSGISNVAEVRTRDEAPAAIADLHVAAASGDEIGQASVTLRWTATGDDADLGQATQYELRYSTAAIGADNFADANLAPGVPAPAIAGSIEEWTVTGLEVDSDYHFAIVAIDERGNRGDVSSTVLARTPDGVGPAAVQDLAAVTGSGQGRVDLSWTAPGDNGHDGRAARYEIRYSEEPIDASNWASAALLSGVATPRIAGSSESAVALELSSEAEYHFVLIAIDDEGNASALSNPASARTADVSPGRVTDLSSSDIGLNQLTLRWTAPGDDGAAGQASRYELRHATQPLSSANFASGTQLSTSTPLVAGSLEALPVSNLAANTRYYFALIAEDERGNRSLLSNVLEASTSDDQPPARVTDLVASTGGVAGSVQLVWTAPGDDDNRGRADRYEVRTSRQPITTSSWQAAELVDNQPTPQSSGSTERFTVTGLAGEQTHHFALRAIDEAGNAGAVSNPAQAFTPPVAPARVTDLSGTAQAGLIALTWTAPGDDDDQGQAVRYDLRYARSPISVGTWNAATPVPDVTDPAVAGATETHVLSGLDESTTYYVALVTEDDTGTTSALSNVLSATTLDETPPSAPTGLSTVSPDAEGRLLHAGTAEASSQLGRQWLAGHALDGDNHTSWASAAMALPAEQWLAVTVSDGHGIDRVRLRSDVFHEALFPRAFDIQVGDGSSWTSVAHEEAFAAPSAGTWMQWGFPASPGDHVRVVITDTAESFGQHYAIIADVEAYEARPASGEVRLLWRAPGDDATEGRASRYQIYRSTDSFGEGSLGGASLVEGAPLPATAGTLESLTVAGLPGERDYYWAVRAVDEAGNTGALSEVVYGPTQAVAPAAVTDLTAVALSQDSVEVAFTAPGDDHATGTAARYDLRYAPWPVTSQNFALATAFDGITEPQPAGSPETFKVSGLSAGTTYRFALVAYDEQDNASYVSNVALATTVPGPDTTPPAQITDLAVTTPDPGGLAVDALVHAFESDQAPAFAADDIADGDLTTNWVSAPSDTDQPTHISLELARVIDAGALTIWPSTSFPELFPRAFDVQVSPDGLAWTTVHSETDYTAAAGIPLMVPFGGEPVSFVALEVTGRAGSGPFYAVVSEVEVHTAPEPTGTVYLGWTAPGDDEHQGQAAAYDLRWSPCPFDLAAATAVPTSAPQPSGVVERYRLAGLPAGDLCFAVTSEDDEGWQSERSNVAQLSL